MNTAKPQISTIGLPKRASLNVTTSTMTARTIQLHAIDRKAISKTDCIAMGRFDACAAGAENFRYATQCMAADTSSTMQPSVTNARDMLRRVIIRFAISSSGRMQSYLQNGVRGCRNGATESMGARKIAPNQLRLGFAVAETGAH